MNQNFAMRSCLGGFGENFQVRNFTVDAKGGRSMGLGAGSTNNSDTEDNSELVQQNPDQGEKADDPIYQRVTNNDQLQDMLLKYGYTFDEDDIKGIRIRDDAPDQQQPNSGGKPKPPRQLLMMMYTCAVEGCGTKQARTFTKKSYEKGVVLVRCEGCDNLHLIADNLGWFEDDGVFKGRAVNVETILKQKGEHVHKFISEEGLEIIQNDPEDEE